MTDDIKQTRSAWNDCNTTAPSQESLPATVTVPPSSPFEEVFADYFDYGGNHYLVVGDRLSGWADVFLSPHGSPQSGADGLVACLRNYFARFGVAIEISSDRGPEFISSKVDSFLKAWGVQHHRLSAAYPRSNGHAEAAVKTTKRLLQSNTGPSGSLDCDNGPAVNV